MPGLDALRGRRSGTAGACGLSPAFWSARTGARPGPGSGPGLSAGRGRGQGRAPAGVNAA